MFFCFFFKKASKTHSYSTRHATTNLVFLPQLQKDHQYGNFCIAYELASTWNDLQNKLGINMLEKSNSKIKTTLVQLYFNNYLN